MTNNELENLLQKVSVDFLYRLSHGSRNANDIQDYIMLDAKKRPLIGFAQILELINTDETHHKVKFGLSPNFLFGSHDISLSGGLDRLTWLFIIPKLPIDEKVSIYEDDVEGAISWLALGKIEICETNPLTYKLAISDLQEAFKSFEF